MIRKIKTTTAVNLTVAIAFLATAGSAFAGQTITASPSSLGYAPVQVGGQSATQGVNVSNVGSGSSLVIGTATLSGANPADFVIAVDSCSQGSLPPVPQPGSDCWINVAFAPTSAGDKTAILNIPSDDPVTPNVEIPLDGHAMTASLDLSPAVAVFDPLAVGSLSLPQTFTATNDGEAVLTITAAPAVGGSNPGDFPITAGTCVPAVVLSPGETCALAATFLPTAGGTRSALLRVPSTASGPADTSALSGEGIGKKPKKCRKHHRHSKKHSKKDSKPKPPKCKKSGGRDRDDD